jgi:type II secretory pathway component PulM
MSPREKNLLIFFAAAGFLVLNFLVIGWYRSKHAEIARQHALAIQKLESAEQFRASREQVTDEMDWLASHEPKPAANQDVQTALQQLCQTQAESAGLTITSQNPQPTDAAAGLYFHRAKIEMAVNGTEEALYRWLDQLNTPEKLRIASSIRLSPNVKDDTKIDCKAVIEQWFVPVPPAS